MRLAQFVHVGPMKPIHNLQGPMLVEAQPIIDILFTTGPRRILPLWPLFATAQRRESAARPQAERVSPWPAARIDRK